ncbi:hypothetical protein JL722_5202 [Aureococcus anophagefferens]|nr:hypothetical protein JL722_5202 [Aureococcus anophagefferens]
MTTNTLTYDERVLRRQLENADWLGSRGLDGLDKLRALVKLTEANDGGMGHPLVALPREWYRAIPLHGAVMNNHVATTLPFLVEDLGVGLESPEKKAGNRPAHTAVIWGHNDVVAYLLARGARHDAENSEGMTLAPMARRRQALLVGGTQAERAYYARNGRRLDLFLVRACAVAMGVKSFEAKEQKKKKGPSKATLKKRAAEEEKAAVEAAEAAVESSDPPLQAALDAAGLGEEQFSRALRWLGATTIAEARDLDRGDVGRVDGLESKERRSLWLFVADRLKQLTDARDGAVAAAREKAARALAAAEPPKLLDNKAGIMFRLECPVGCFALVAKFAYNARPRPPPPRPITDERLLAAVAGMKI